MAYATTSSFAKTTLGVEFVAGTFANICGITQWSYSETTQLDETEVPDCADLDKPFQIERSVRSVGAQASCSGVWALASHQKMLDWSRSGVTKPVKISFLVAQTSGTATDTVALTGDAYLTNLSFEVTKGQKVSASFELVFDGLPVPTLKGA